VLDGENIITGQSWKRLLC